MSRTLSFGLVAAGSIMLPAAVLAQTALQPPGRLAIAANTALKLDMAAVLQPPAEQPPAAVVEMDDSIGSDAWTFSLTPILWVPAISGTAATNGNVVDVNLTQGDAFEALGDPHAGIGVHAEFGPPDFTIFVEGLYIDTEDEGSAGATTGIRHGILEAGIAFPLFDTNPHSEPDVGVEVVVEPIAGIRGHFVELDISIPASGIGSTDDKIFVDGFGGLRFRVALDGPLAFFGRADFGAGGSEFTWHAIAGAELRVASWITIQGGYRWLKVDFEDGSGTDLFEYDTLTQGPFLAVNLKF